MNKQLLSDPGLAHHEVYRGAHIYIMQDEVGLHPRDASNLGTLVVSDTGSGLACPREGDMALRSDSELDSFVLDLAGSLEEREEPFLLLDDALEVLEKHAVYILFRLRDYGSGGYSLSETDDVEHYTGILYVEDEDIEREMIGGSRERALEVLRAELAELRYYVTRDQYGYIAETEAGETIGSCWGFAGYDPRGTDKHSSWGYMLEEARSEIDYHITAARKRHAERVKAWIRNRVPLAYRSPFTLCA